MNTITCGNTHMIEPAERIVRAIRASEGFEETGGCGRVFDASNVFQLNQLYRCVECGQWLCKPCILTHFAKTSDHVRVAQRTETAS